MDNTQQVAMPMSYAAALFADIKTAEGAYAAGATEGKTFANASERLRSAVMISLGQPENIREGFINGLIDGLKSSGATGKVYASVFNRIMTNIKKGHVAEVQKALSNPGGITEQVKRLPLGADGEPPKSRKSKASSAVEQPAVKVGAEKFAFAIAGVYHDGKIGYTSQIKKEVLLKDDAIGAAVELFKLFSQNLGFSNKNMAAIFTAIAEEAIAVSDEFDAKAKEQKAIEGTSEPVETESNVEQLHQEAA
jgi:hypothetical protein